MLRLNSYSLPITFWLELVRRSLVGNVAQAFPTLVSFSNLELIGILAAYTFRWCDFRAREKGLIDCVTNY